MCLILPKKDARGKSQTTKSDAEEWEKKNEKQSRLHVGGGKYYGEIGSKTPAHTPRNACVC